MATSTPPRAIMVCTPLAYMTAAMEQNTPTGVQYMTQPTTLMQMEWKDSHSFTTGSAFLPRVRQAMPTMMAKTSTCSMSPVAKEATGLAGIRFFTVSRRLVNFAASTVESII